MEDYERLELSAKLKLALWLLNIADEQGLTHGEKHHFHHVINHILTGVREQISGKSALRNTTYPERLDGDDIPF